MNNQPNILKRGLILVLAFSIFNLFQGCMTYHLIDKDVNEVSLYAKYVNENKYFILYNNSGVYHLSDIQIINGTISAVVSPVDSCHVRCLIMAGEYPTALRLKHRNTNVDNEVILYTALEIPKDAKNVVIPLSSVQKLNCYKWRLTGGSIAAIIIPVLGLVALGIWAIISFNQYEEQGGIWVGP